MTESRDLNAGPIVAVRDIVKCRAQVAPDRCSGSTREALGFCPEYSDVAPMRRPAIAISRGRKGDRTRLLSLGSGLVRFATS